jgi:hypothetical protein
MPAPNGAYSCIVSCNVYSTDTCTVWFDDVQLYEALKWKTYYVSPDSVVIEIGDSVSATAGCLDSDDGQYYTIAAETSDDDWWTDWYGEVKIGEFRDDVKRLWVGYDGHYSVGERNQKIYLRNWTAEPDTWDILCATDTSGSCKNKIRQADITHGWSTANTNSIQDYIRSDRLIQFRVMAKDTSATFNCLADYMRITVQYEPQ